MASIIVDIPDEQVARIVAAYRLLYKSDKPITPAQVIQIIKKSTRDTIRDQVKRAEKMASEESFNKDWTLDLGD